MVVLSFVKSQACIKELSYHSAPMSTQFQDMGSVIVPTQSQILVTLLLLMLVSDYANQCFQRQQKCLCFVNVL